MLLPSWWLIVRPLRGVRISSDSSEEISFPLEKIPLIDLLYGMLESKNYTRLEYQIFRSFVRRILKKYD